jgi:hypothetical protein
MKKRLFKFGGKIAGAGISVSSLLKATKAKNKKNYFLNLRRRRARVFNLQYSIVSDTYGRLL